MRVRRARAKALAAFVVALVLGGAPARAVPLRDRPAGPGVHYFGYWGSAAQGVGEAQWGNLPPGVDNPDPSCQAGPWTGYTSCIADHANVTHITFGIGQEDWALARLREAADRGMGVVLTVWNYFFKVRAGDVRKIDLVDGYEVAWAKFLGRIDDAYIKRSHTILAFYIYDEPSTDPQTIANLGTVARLLARTAPDVHRWVTFTAKDVDQAAFTIPADIDWLSYDCYAVDGASPSFDRCSPTYDDGYEFKSLSYYRDKLKELIRKTPNVHPQLVLIPQAFLPPGGANLQADLLARLGPEIEMAKSDPDYVMITPFLWQAVTSLPSVRRQLRADGAGISGGALRSDDVTDAVALAQARAQRDTLTLRLQPPCGAEPSLRLVPSLEMRPSGCLEGRRCRIETSPRRRTPAAACIPGPPGGESGPR